MSPDITNTMKPILLTPGEGRRGWIRLGNDAAGNPSSVSESKENRCYVSSHRHGGVRGVGMLRSVIEKSREILAAVFPRQKGGTPHVASYQNSEDMRSCKEVGRVYSSVDDFVMKFGAKEPYLVDVNREAKDM